MKTSIIMLAHNQLHLTMDCVEAVKRFTGLDGDPWEFIGVNNGSRDQTGIYLEKLELWNDNVRLVMNDGNLGFPAGVNQGLRMARGEYIVLLNNDIVVTPRWEISLRGHLEKDAKLGVVCATTNLCGNEAMIPSKYRSVVEMLSFAKTYTAERYGIMEDLPMVGFYCIMFRRSLLDEIGLLDERFTPGYFEDDDYCVRVRKAGYKVAVARDVFVHHAHQGTFRSMRNAGQIVKRSQKQFEAKYGIKVEKKDSLDYSYIENAVQSTPSKGVIDEQDTGSEADRPEPTTG